MIRHSAVRETTELPKVKALPAPLPPEVEAALTTIGQAMLPWNSEEVQKELEAAEEAIKALEAKKDMLEERKGVIEKRAELLKEVRKAITGEEDD